MKQLPWMGLGLSTNLGPRDRPDPWRLHERAPGLFDFVEYSAPLDVETARVEAARFETLLERRNTLPAIFHPVHLNLWGPELESAANLAALRMHLEVVGSPWVGNDVGWWHHRDVPFPGYLFVAPPFTRAGVEQCAIHAAHVQAAIDVPLLLENPAVLYRHGDLHVLDFLAALQARTGQPLLLDLGHLLAYQLAHGLDPRTGLDGFPLEHVAEIHIAGGVITARGDRRFYVDDHGQPVREELFELLEAILPRCTGLRALTFEADGHPETVAAATLQRLRLLMPPPDAPPSSLERHAAVALASVHAGGAIGSGDGEGPAEAAGPLARATDEAWRLFDLVHTAQGDFDDPAGLEAEADFRLAVLAQHLDKSWPLTRTICAGDSVGLRRFAGSPEYRALYDGTGRELPGVFATWARRHIREAKPLGGDVALAFESFCHGLLARAATARPPAGSIALAPGVAAGTFPVDLTELLFAARSLRRHLGDRAAASGRYEASGLDALGQIAARAPQRPWALLARMRDNALEVEPVDPALLRLLHAAARGAAPGDLDDADRAAFERGRAAGILRVA